MQTAGLSQVYICMLLIRNYKQKFFRHYVLMFRSTNEMEKKKEIWKEKILQHSKLSFQRALVMSKGIILNIQEILSFLIYIVLKSLNNQEYNICLLFSHGEGGIHFIQ